MISLVSETAFGIRDNGVHTAFEQQLAAFRSLRYAVATNSVRASSRSAVTISHSHGPFSLACITAASGRSVVYGHITPSTLAGSFRWERGWGQVAPEYIRRFYRRARLVISVSEVARRELLELGIPEEQIHTIAPGIDHRRFSTPPSEPAVRRMHARLRARGLDKGPRSVVLGVGQLQPRKGIDIFAAMALDFPEAVFVWVGGRPFGRLTAGYRWINDLMRAAPPNLIFVGRVPTAELVAYYHLADVFFLPSRQENFGLAVVEAAATGLPLVISDIPAFRENFGCAAVLGTRVDFRTHLGTLLADSESRSKHAASAKRLARAFDARDSARRVLSLVRQKADDFGAALA